MKLMNHIYQVGGPSISHDFDATAYLIEGQEGLYLLDCGTPDGFNQIVENIKSLGFDPKNIKAIYGTHGHYDHVGGAAKFKEVYDSKLYLHPFDREQVEVGDNIKTTAALLYGNPFPACQVDKLLEDQEKVAFGNGITMEVLHTPGHSKGSVCFALDCNGYSFLVAGDTIWGGYSDLIGSDESLWKKSLDYLTSKHYDGYSFGHVGPNVIADADTRLAEAKRQFATYYNPWFRPMKDAFKY